MQRFTDRVVVVTGASRGIGAAAAERLAAEGARVALVARTADHHPVLAGSLADTARRCRAHGAEALTIVADLTDPDDRARVIPAVEDALGPVDVLVNNAAAAIYEPTLELSLKRRRLMTELNVHAPVDLARDVAPGMIERGEGWIVNLSSASAEHPEGPPYDLGGVRGTYGFYGATKAMLDRLTTALASELHHHGIRVNAVEPRAAVLTEGADARVDPSVLAGKLETIEAMVEALTWLCCCPADHTGRLEVSLELIAREGLEVRTLDTRSPAPLAPS